MSVFGELEPEPVRVHLRLGLADLLADAGIPAHVAHPLATQATAAGRVKNDAVHARTLAHLLRGTCCPRPGWLLRKLERLGGWRGCGHP